MRDIKWNELIRLVLCVAFPLAGVVLVANALAAKDPDEARNLGVATAAGVLIYLVIFVL